MDKDTLGYISSSVSYPKKDVKKCVTWAGNKHKVPILFATGVIKDQCKAPELMGVHTNIGKRDYNEDRYIYEKTVVGGKECVIAGIFDGHGGDFVVKKTKKKLVPYIVDHLFKFEEKTIKKVFIDFDAYLRSLVTGEDTSGSTACVCMFSEGVVWVV